MYRKLDATRIIETATLLHVRIGERFPGSGLSRVAADLEAVTREAAALTHWIARPIWKLRVAVFATLALLFYLIGAGVAQMRMEVRIGGWAEMLQGVEAMVNDLVFLAIGIYFLVGLELRHKRRKALAALHVLRSLAHIVDMHQLTKDPERLAMRGPDTPHSPKRTMTAFELTRYLDYSTEMLAIVSKLSALYVQEFNDPVTVEAASAVEELSIGLSRSIWQKIVILDRIMAPQLTTAELDPAG